VGRAHPTFLFAGSVGRSDFPGGSHDLLIQMIKEKLLILPEQTKVYPGHGPATTLRSEKKFNPFLT
jgi:glyoxylase-like metal-dependent hydrolase (beta-lactamase superfamily II)